MMGEGSLIYLPHQFELLNAGDLFPTALAICDVVPSQTGACPNMEN